MTSQLAVENLSVELAGKRVVSDVSFALNQGDIACLLGPSGCGKTTILRAIAGFESPRAGNITVSGHEVANAVHQWTPEARRVGMVFQDLALFPHLTVAQNIAFGLHRHSKSEIASRVQQLLELVSLQGLARRYPHQLSGGQQQRIALIRAMAPRPPVLLLDEPFSGQDSDRRVHLAQEVRTLLKHDKITGILVTHDQNEAFSIADDIGVMAEGRLRQWAKADELYCNPVDRVVAEIIGDGVFVAGTVIAGHRVQTEIGDFELCASQSHLRQQDTVELLIRPEDVVHDEGSATRASVVSRHYRGADCLCAIDVQGHTRLLSLVPANRAFDVGDRVGVRVRIEKPLAFPSGDA
ncbi:MAG: ABC transporter ATP-binding protein [Pseudomonadota bacterium]